MGISEDIVKELAVQTVIGSAKMILESDKTPQQLIDMVTSPKGTTLEAMEVLYKNDFEKIIADAMEACTKRAIEISQGK